MKRYLVRNQICKGFLQGIPAKAVGARLEWTLFSYNLYVYTHAQHAKLDSTYLNYSKKNTAIVEDTRGCHKNTFE